MQKRLLLCDLKELYSLFKTEWPKVSISFSKFASIRPEWCIPAGPKGTHHVCICSLHQNVKLLLDSVSLCQQYQELIDMIVCDRTSSKCMIHRCNKCPGIAVLEESLRSIITRVHYESEESTHEDEHDENHLSQEFINFLQWTTTDRTELVSQTLSVEDFIDKLCSHLDDITAHSFISKSQALYLKMLKEQLKEDEAIILMDFAENFKFVVQDEVQGYHWNQNQCTLHPVVIYHRYNESRVLVTNSICFLSEDLEHDVNFVYAVMKGVVNYVEHVVSNRIKTIHYFSDGCAGQYKNCKNFINLCHHQEDFGIDCQWNFFATSHGKSPCDGIGGTIKRLTARASLQRPLREQILSVEQMFEFCKYNLEGIQPIHLSKEEIIFERQQLHHRLGHARTIPGTRGFHQFVPLSNSVIGAKRISETETFELKFDFSNTKHQVNDKSLMNGDFVVCRYDFCCWVGIISQVDRTNQDVLVKFMHPSLPSGSFTWPRKDDLCWVPIVKVLDKLGQPQPTTMTGRQYTFIPADVLKMQQCVDVLSQ